MIIVKYLKRSLNFKLRLRRDNITLYGYCDADWIRDANDTRVTISYAYVNGVGDISLNCKIQPINARPQTEYIPTSHRTMDVIWLKLLLNDIGLVQVEAKPLNCGNDEYITFSMNL